MVCSSMFSAHLSGKLFSIIRIAIDSAPLYVFHCKNQAFVTPNFSRAYKNPIFVHFCSLVNVKSEDVDSNAASSASKSKRKLSNNAAKDNSFTVSYLMNSCGFSREKAITVSKEVHFRTPERPNSLLALLKKHGFSKSQIANVVWRRPRLLLYNAKKTIVPKFEFLQKIGFSVIEIAGLLSRDPTFLSRSLEKQLIPAYIYLKNILVSDKKVVMAVKRSTWLFIQDPHKTLEPNIAILRESRVPQSSIVLLLTNYPETIMQSSAEFNEAINEVKEMGFDPSKSAFVLALHALSGKSNRFIWTRCYEIYSKWGWSKDDIYMAFRRHPGCMLLSEKKIMKTMEFLVNQMGLEHETITKNSTILSLSLEKRIVPRWSVIHILSMKGLIKKKIGLSTFLTPSEEVFFKKYMEKYDNEVPELYAIYEGRVSISET